MKQKCLTIRQRYTRNLLLIALPLAALLLISNFYSIRANNDKLAESNRRMVEYWTEQTEENLGTIELFLSNLTLNEREMNLLAVKSRPEDATEAMLSLLDRFDTAGQAFPAISGLFFYSEPNELFAARFPDPNAQSYQQRESMRAQMRSLLISGDPAIRKWSPRYINGEYYLTRFFFREGAGMAAAVALENLTPKSLDGQATILYRNLDDNQPLTGQEFIERTGIVLGMGEEFYNLSGSNERYMIMEQPVEKAGFAMVYVLSEAGFWDGLDSVQMTILILSVFTILMIFGMYRWLNRWLNIPIQQLTQIMERIKQGELESQIETNFNTRELMQVRDTFNDMMLQIQHLKIDRYERELESQHMQLQYLYRQIRPHFFLNCLKSLYACARQQKTEQMQEMILSLSNHIRYWFRDSRTLVTLEEEVRYAVNYIKIQQLSLVPPPTFEVEMDESIRNYQIPPFTVQTFVENSIKHEWNPERPLHIAIRANIIEDDGGAYINVCVADSGDGFPEDMLVALNDPQIEYYAQHHIGLNNIKHRLKLIYGDRALMAFYNNPGSHSEIIVPAFREEEQA